MKIINLKCGRETNLNKIDQNLAPMSELNQTEIIKTEVKEAHGIEKKLANVGNEI